MMPANTLWCRSRFKYSVRSGVNESGVCNGSACCPPGPDHGSRALCPVSWKYSAIAYELILKDVGVLMQTFYLMATDMELGGCAIGIVNIDLFAKMTGIEFHVEGPVGQFAIGRGIKPRTPPPLL
jgi:nitroreductase